MSDFADQMRRISLKIETREKAVFVRVVELARDSIVDGSALTGAPGQKVDTGFLKSSWQTVFLDANTAIIGTKVSYAPAIEDGSRESFDPSGVDRPKNLKPRGPGTHGPIASTVGGNHSVKLTLTAAPRILRQAVADVGGTA